MFNRAVLLGWPQSAPYPMIHIGSRSFRTPTFLSCLLANVLVKSWILSLLESWKLPRVLRSIVELDPSFRVLSVTSSKPGNSCSQKPYSLLMGRGLRSCFFFSVDWVFVFRQRTGPTCSVPLTAQASSHLNNLACPSQSLPFSCTVISQYGMAVPHSDCVGVSPGSLTCNILCVQTPRIAQSQATRSFSTWYQLQPLHSQ